MATRKILIVDNNQDDIEAIQRALGDCEAIPYEFYVAPTEELSLELLKDQHFDCLLLDYHLPGVSGLELFRAIKAQAPTVPIVVLTGPTDQLMAASLLKQGAQDYINKFALNSLNLHEKISAAIEHASAFVPRRSALDCKVLIIDGNTDDIEACRRLLRKAPSEYTVEHAMTGHQGLAMIAGNEPDCILLDDSMPGATGLDLLTNIVTNHPFVPVVMMTGQGNESVAVNAIKFGAQDYLVKSDLKASRLDKVIGLAVQKKQHERQLLIKEQELEEAHNFLEIVFQSVPGYLFVKDKDFRLVKMNDHFLHLYGVEDQNTILGRTTFEDYDPVDVEYFLAKDKEAFANGSSETIEQITFPNGEIRTLHTIKQRFNDNTGEPFILGAAADVTERDLLISKLRKSNEDLEQFAYIASHDLKSPLNAIKKLVTWIEEDYGDQLPQGAKAHFDMIKSRSVRLGQLLNDLLAYSRLNKKLSDAEPFNFQQLALNAHELNAEFERFTLVASDLDIVLPKAAMQIVLLNLLGNTIKHHDKGYGHIQMDVIDCQSHYEIHYFDDGPGIPREYAEKVFQMFHTLKPKDEVEGSGMGLAMVKKVVEYYQGTVELVYGDKFTSGVHFKIVWPVHQVVNTLAHEAVYDQI
ncbi:response regulator [Thalassotalea euphylliae]|uniref:histidine kinase n=1 Tax=Thalassotalea euphylliae TaxID=1655234 RepID=A0A3E0TVG8_9GAMM|nr:response regulator [Thalassotalea euphylliae]REL28666.1 response regulator [Thalassotalea euphylliae]